LQWSVGLLGLQPKDFGINKEVSTSKSPEGIMNMSIICAWVKHFIAGFYQHFYFCHKFLVLKIPKSVMQDHIGDGQSTFGGYVLVNNKF
jgi:hypothetical protein